MGVRRGDLYAGWFGGVRVGSWQAQRCATRGSAQVRVQRVGWGQPGGSKTGCSQVIADYKVSAHVKVGQVVMK